MQLTVTARRSSGDTSDTVTQGIEMDLGSAKRSFSVFHAVEDTQVFVVPHNQLINVTEIRPKDFIYDGTSHWSVLQVDRVQHGNQWVCLCNKQKDSEVPSVAMAAICLADMAGLKARLPAVGDVAWIPHHTTAGDGGGGFFEAIDTATTGDTDVPDQGIFVIADGHDATATSETVTASFGSGGQTLANNPVVSGTLSFNLTSGASCTDAFLHGHTFGAGSPNPWLDYSLGTIDEQDLTLLTNATGATVSVTYNYATSTLRWRRVWDGRIADLRWWGPAKTNAAAIDDRNLLCWALEHASRLGAKGLVLNCDIRQHGTIEWPSGLAVYGSTERGVKHKIKVVDSIAEEWSYVTVPVNALYDLTMGQCCTTPKSNAASVIIENLEWDGNISNNLDGFDTPSIISGGDAQHILNLQDAPTWTFLQYNGHNGRTINADLEIHIKNVEFHDAGSHGIVAHQNGYMISKNIKAYNFRIGRPFYSVRGDHEDWTFEGYSDDEYARVANGTRMRRVRFVNLTTNPHSGRGGGPLISTGGYWTAADPDANEHDVREAHISDIYADVRGDSAMTVLFWWTGEGNVLENVTLWFNQANLVVFSQSPNRVTGSGHWWHRGYRISNVQIIAGADYHLFGTATAPQFIDNAIFENFDLRQDVTVAALGEPLTLFGYIDAANRGETAHANVDMAEPTHRKVQRFNNINVQGECGQYALVDIPASNVEEVDIYVSNSRLMLHSTLQADRPLRAIPNGGAAVSDLTDSTDLDQLRFFFENCQMQATANVTGSNSELSLALSRFRNCEDKNGRRSDEGGLYEPAVAVGGEDFVDIPTNLWHTPREIKVEGVGQDMEDAGIARVEAVDSGGTTLDPDDVTSHEHDPLIRAHFTNALSVNDVIKIRWRASVRTFEST